MGLRFSIVKAGIRPGLILLIAWMAGGCSGPEMKLAEDGVSEFHSLFESGRTADIYVQASPQFQRAGTMAEFLAYTEAVHRKLGPMRSTEKQTWRVDYNTAGRFASLGYQTQYERGTAYEQFVYLVDSGKAKLVSYNINSPDLVTK